MLNILNFNTLKEANCNKVCDMFVPNDNVLLKEELIEKKNEIDSTLKWVVAKKYANEFEFVFSFNYDGIANINPISRSYFKLIEILQDNMVLDDFDGLHTACLCEGPGGFIQAICDYTNKNNIKLLSPIDCITLLSENKKIPKWKLCEVPRKSYNICYGLDGTGNIYNIDNMDFFINSCKEKKHLITADGGFDFSSDFNSQEEDFLHLLLCEIYIALNIQMENGHFIVKCFDLFHECSIIIICFLRIFYDSISIQKPRTSRPANSEKYIICKKFKQLDGEKIKKIKSLKENLKKQQYSLYEYVDTSNYLETQRTLHSFNKLIVQRQISYINKTIEYSKKKIYDKNENINFCIDWCNEYQIPIKKIYS